MAVDIKNKKGAFGVIIILNFLYVSILFVNLVQIKFSKNV